METRRSGASRRRVIMTIVGYVMLSAIVLYLTQQVSDL
jgi:hypothetical protein